VWSCTQFRRTTQGSYVHVNNKQQPLVVVCSVLLYSCIYVLIYIYIYTAAAIAAGAPQRPGAIYTAGGAPQCTQSGTRRRRGGIRRPSTHPEPYSVLAQSRTALQRSRTALSRRGGIRRPCAHPEPYSAPAEPYSAQALYIYIYIYIYCYSCRGGTRLQCKPVQQFTAYTDSLQN
jgi:hypothetical protein